MLRAIPRYIHETRFLTADSLLALLRPKIVRRIDHVLLVLDAEFASAMNPSIDDRLVQAR